MGAYVSSDDFESLKKACARALPQVKSSHRAEAAARALGFGSNAALRAALGSGPRVVDLREDLFLAFLKARGVHAEMGCFADAVRDAGLFDDPGRGGIRLGATVADNGLVRPFLYMAGAGWAHWPDRHPDTRSFEAGSRYEGAWAILASMRRRMRSVALRPEDIDFNPDGFIPKWMAKRERPIMGVLPDGSVVAQRYAGMGHWMNDFGPAMIADGSPRPVPPPSGAPSPDVPIPLEAFGPGRVLREMGTFQGRSGETGVSYRDSLEGRAEAADRIEMRDLQSQRAGEAHILLEDRVVRTETFHADPPDLPDAEVLAFGPSYFIPVPKPSSDEIERAKRAPDIVDRMADAKHATSMKADGEAALDAEDPPGYAVASPSAPGDGDPA